MKSKTKRYSVYVIELSKRAWQESSKLRRANPQFNPGLQCLYVGMTNKSPQERFEQHRTGYRNKKGAKISSSIVEKYGMYLRPSLYSHFEKMSQKDALALEKKLALILRRQRYAVWFG